MTELFGGKLWVESEVGKGSVFHFTVQMHRVVKLEVPSPPVLVATVAPVSAPLVEAAINVLLAEDNVVNQKVAVRMLERRGHRVVVASNGKEAVEALKQQVFDAVLMDIHMPEMDGVEATCAIRASEKDGARIPIIALTADVLPEDRERCMAAGMDAYLTKPIQPKLLFATLEELSRAHQR